MDFKIWLCIEEILHNLSVYRRKLTEATNLADLMGASQINDLIQNITGVKKHYLQLILIQARNLAKAGVSAEELANIAVAKIWNERDKLQEKIRTIRSTGKKIPTENNPDPVPFADEKAMENYIVNFVIKSGVNGMLEFQRSGGQRSLVYLFRKYKKAVQEGKPFTGFDDNVAAKSAFISEFPSDSFDNQSFAAFLRNYGHNMAHDIAARSLVRGKESEEGDVSGRSIAGAAGVGSDLELEEMKTKLKSILTSMKSSAGTDANERNIENALKFVDVLDMAQQGHGWKKTAGEAVGVNDQNLVFQAFKQIKLAAERLAHSEGSEFMKDRIKQLTSDIPTPVAPAPVARTAPTSPVMPVSSTRPAMQDNDQGHDARLGF